MTSPESDRPRHTRSQGSSPARPGGVRPGDHRRGCSTPGWSLTSASSDGGQPFVLPVGYARVGDDVLIHGSTASRAFKTRRRRRPDLPDRHPARRHGLRPVGLQLVDELPLRGRARHRHAGGRRGQDRGVAAAQRAAGARATGTAVRQPSVQELKATSVLRLSLRRGLGQGQRRAARGRRRRPRCSDYWAGVVPLTQRSPPPPEPAPEVARRAGPYRTMSRGWRPELRTS